MKNKFIFVVSIFVGTTFFVSPAFAAVPTLVSAKISGANTLTLVYSEPVATMITDYSSFTGALSGKALFSLVGSGSNTITLTVDGSSFSADATGGLTVGSSVRSVADSLPSATSSVQVLDGQAPSVMTLNVTSLDTAHPLAKIGNGAVITFNVNEQVNLPAVSINGHTLGVSGSGPGPYTTTYNFVNGDPASVLGITIALTDTAGNSGRSTISVTSNLTSSSSTVSSVVGANAAVSAPAISEVTPIPYFTTSQTPSYVFYSNATGTISYGGGCAGVVTAATTGNNTITFNPLVSKFYNNCTITVTNGAGSSTLHLSPFTVDSTWTPASETDTTPVVVVPQFRFTKALKLGSSGTEVKELQKLLKVKGLFFATPNGHFGPATQKAVKALQRVHGLKQVGTVGPATRAVLNKK